MTFYCNIIVIYTNTLMTRKIEQIAQKIVSHSAKSMSLHKHAAALVQGSKILAVTTSQSGQHAERQLVKWLKGKDRQRSKCLVWASARCGSAARA